MSQRADADSMMHKILKAGVSGKEDDWEEYLLENMTKVSMPLAVKMLAQAGIHKDTTAPFTLLDEGCGLGVVAGCLQDTVSKDVLARSSMVSSDYSGALVGFVQNRIQKKGWINTEAKVLDAQNTGLPAQSFTHVTLNISFHAIPDSHAALEESIRLLKPGGLLAFTTWHEQGVGWLEDVTTWGRWYDVNWVRKTLIEHGLADVKVDVLAHLTHVENAGDFIMAYGNMLGWAVKAAGWSEELKGEHGEGEVKELVRKHLEDKYGAGEGWDLTWVSIIASGRVPAN